MTDSQNLLAEYVQTGSDTAFRELVTRYVDLVYSTALRLVENDTHRAEDVAQTVFVDLARKARSFSNDVMLGGWLHRHTCFVAANTMRGERRRQSRERQAVEMTTLQDNSGADFSLVAPILDEAINELGEADRTAILLRFFEQHDFRSVGQALGSNEDAARMRVTRALDKLESLLKRRGVTTSSAALAVVLSANAVQAAPVGLAVTVSAAAVLAGTAVSTSAIAATTTIVMTTLQKALITATIAVAMGAGIYEARQASALRNEVQTLHRQQAPLTAQIQQLQRERDDATNRLASLASENATLKKNPTEVLKLRGEVGRLREENTAVKSTSALNKITANPETKKLLRDQQKVGMKAIYEGFARGESLAPEQAEKLYDLQADYIMANVDRVTEALHDNAKPEQINQMFATEDAALLEKIQAALGPDAAAHYQQYTRDLASSLTTQQFKGNFTGSDAAKEEKTKQLYQAMQQETQLALSSAGLPADYQTVPMLNFRNIASEEEGERSLKLLDGIYERVAERGSSFLSAEELQKFKEFRTIALNSSRLQLTMNRKMMAPISK